MFKMVSLVEQSATPVAKKSRVVEASSSIPIIEATHLDMVPLVQEIVGAPSVQPSPKTAPQVSEEAEASSPLKEKATKRERKTIQKNVTIIFDSESSDEPSPAPKTRKPTLKKMKSTKKETRNPTPKKRKSTKKASIEATSSETPSPA